MNNDIDYSGYENLANEIIITAKKDYCNVLRAIRRRRYPTYRMEFDKMQLEKFVRSSWFSTLSRHCIESEDLIRHCQHEINEEHDTEVFKTTARRYSNMNYKLKNVDGKVAFLLKTGDDFVKSSTSVEIAQSILDSGKKISKSDNKDFPICVDGQYYFAGTANELQPNKDKKKAKK